MKPDYVRFAVTMSEGPVCIFAFVTYGDSPTLPLWAYWAPEKNGRWIRPATDTAVRAELAKAFPPDQPQPVSWRAIRPDEIPADASFRNAWKDDGRVIGHDMAKAREMHRDRLRAARMPALDELDRLYMRESARQGAKSELDAIEAKRQVLRDVTDDPRIDAAASVDELKAVTLPEVVEVPSGRRP